MGGASKGEGETAEGNIENGVSVAQPGVHVFAIVLLWHDCVDKTANNARLKIALATGRHAHTHTRTHAHTLRSRLHPPPPAQCTICLQKKHALAQSRMELQQPKLGPQDASREACRRADGGKALHVQIVGATSTQVRVCGAG